MDIALFGVRGSGKDTIGAYLETNHSFTRTSFALPLKRMAQIAFPDFTDEDLYGDTANRERPYPQYPKGSICVSCGGPLFPDTDGMLSCVALGCSKQYPKSITPRLALQSLGTEWGRRLHEDIWADAAVSYVKKTHGEFVITDGRYANEQRACTAAGIMTVLLLRKLDESTDTHASEAELKTIPQNLFHYILDNRCALEELPSKIEEMMRTLKG